jgi:hypothetical protein
MTSLRVRVLCTAISSAVEAQLLQPATQTQNGVRVDSPPLETQTAATDDDGDRQQASKQAASECVRSLPASTSYNADVDAKLGAEAEALPCAAENEARSRCTSVKCDQGDSTEDNRTGSWLRWGGAVLQQGWVTCTSSAAKSLGNKINATR